jgi:hypothetical protein
MITAKDCLAKFGPPETEKHMVLFDVPAHLEIGAIPNRIYCNRLMPLPLEKAFGLLKSKGLGHLIKTWDGCFLIRPIRGGKSRSLHSWGLAVDINANWNRLATEGTMDKGVVACFKEAGFDWGGDFESRKDPMHFQLGSI